MDVKCGQILEAGAKLKKGTKRLFYNHHFCSLLFIGFFNEDWNFRSTSSHSPPWKRKLHRNFCKVLFWSRIKTFRGLVTTKSYFVLVVFRPFVTQDQKFLPFPQSFWRSLKCPQNMEFVFPEWSPHMDNRCDAEYLSEHKKVCFAVVGSKHQEGRGIENKRRTHRVLLSRTWLHCKSMRPCT